MFGINLGYYHGNIGGPSVGTVVGYHRGFGLCVCFLDGLDLILGHIYRTEYEINLCGYFFYFIDIHNNDLLYRFRHRSIHLPASSDSFLISLSCGTGRCGKHLYVEPGAIFQQNGKTLSYHTRSTDNTYVVVFHFSFHPSFFAFSIFS